MGRQWGFLSRGRMGGAWSGPFHPAVLFLLSKGPSAVETYIINKRPGCFSENANSMCSARPLFSAECSLRSALHNSLIICCWPTSKRKQEQQSP